MLSPEAKRRLFRGTTKENFRETMFSILRSEMEEERRQRGETTIRELMEARRRGEWAPGR